jgi:hypothetical protein
MSTFKFSGGRKKRQTPENSKGPTLFNPEDILSTETPDELAKKKIEQIQPEKKVIREALEEVRSIIMNIPDDIEPEPLPPSSSSSLTSTGKTRKKKASPSETIPQLKRDLLRIEGLLNILQGRYDQLEADYQTLSMASINFQSSALAFTLSDKQFNPELESISKQHGKGLFSGPYR